MPHNNTNSIKFSDKVNSNKAIFFAVNGTGKSFISRTFRLAESDNYNVISNNLITIDQSIGQMEFKIEDKVKCKNLSIKIEKDKTPVINNNSDFIFHVFNSDFVEDNIKLKHYNADGNIEGYILGKIQIDLTEEKELKKKKEIELENLSNCSQISLSYFIPYLVFNVCFLSKLVITFLLYRRFFIISQAFVLLF